MAEENTVPNGAAEAAPQIKQRILAQFVRDLSFENIMAQKGVDGEVKPEIKVEVNLDARKRGAENQYEIITKLKVTSTNAGSDKSLFLLELEYSGIFEIEGVPEQQMHPYLMIECPRMTFPFIRRIVSDVTRDGGFPPLNLEQIDFVAIYRQQLALRAQQQADQQKTADA
ncbi:protein-export chaperone SecB [Octadecabacter sp. 1_MG-2023]|uniref:protein-export chaperone SecB n=1 Tax=unclassified Octadecabacter TaxID=196158 RepID=UPI001C0902EF|nr:MULTISPECIES: protein-export chaperone SecB [unclassified Octadecabacter]MBU2992318.1 protein-export chaperone SecB [Octadecabacter sp. B2R22]MDO6734925.1 protein-export chaperone SecB [Octadecabacter sp. 1_MG-2023]